MNFVKYGLISVGGTVCARSLSTIGRDVVITNNVVAGVTEAWVLPLNTDPDDTYFAFGFGTGGGNFPYGILVEPDVHL